ncbi:CDC48 family AAA ATPase [Halarchaeum sp. CBA1220]|uniref:CDC48 family AAA ATPase n=1 Tax=Halarchaeum sp. CBA1220 TaxID=1853682 RepID=UPI000F3A852C|nr:CDC48 family AAA ATPase [Halarchaeum sp. CBA1220]QLC34570.1 CDC48 family AAA ATPase [Halarchaeum sp. CBA1220]
MSEDSGRRLVVREAAPRDAGRGIVRLPDAVRRDLGVLSGDTVRIVGAGATVAKVWPDATLDADELRIDGATRANAGVSVGETVRVEKATVREAERVVVTPSVPPARERAAVEDAVRDALFDRPVSEGETVRVDALGEIGEFRVTHTDPGSDVVVTGETSVEVAVEEPGAGANADADAGDGAGVGVTYEDVGGLGEELAAVRELVELPLTDPGRFRRMGVEPPKGVLLYGPPGTGKTLIARAVANEVDAHFVSVSGPEITSKYKGESEEQLREVFEEAREHAPSIVFFDEFDAIAGERDDAGDMENRIVGQLLSLMDGLEGRGEVVVIGATNRVNAIDPALRRGGRFDREIEIGVPSRGGRAEILDVLTRGMPLADDVDLGTFADRTHGYVGADLRALVTEAAMAAIRDDRDTVTRADLETAFASTDPSAMREVVAESPDVSFDDIGGLEDAKATLREAVQWPLQYASLFEAAHTDPPTGVLLYGPPGTGKTMLARAIGHESGVNVVRVAGPELVDKYVGESEKAVREVFERARRTAPCVVFFDEIDAVASARGPDTSESTERVVSQLLTELDAAAENPNLVVLAATNRRDALDPALLRPGRFETHVHVPRPDEAARRAVLGVHAREKPLAEDVDLDAVAERTDGYTGADLAAVVRAAALDAIRDTVDAHPEDAADHPEDVRIRGRHFEDALERYAASR